MFQTESQVYLFHLNGAINRIFDCLQRAADFLEPNKGEEARCPYVSKQIQFAQKAAASLQNHLSDLLASLGTGAK